MRLAILSRESKNYSTARFVEAARRRDHEVKVLDTLRFAIDLRSREPDLFYRLKHVEDFDAVLPRVNSLPGLEGIEGATRLDIAGAVIDFIAAQVNFPELDVRQRLTVSRGYGVAELHIPEGSEYAGRTIAESGLRDKDINVLSLHRDGKVIPNPRGDRDLQGGDRLLCFGKLESMRHMVPARVRRERRPQVEQLRAIEA